MQNMSAGDEISGRIQRTNNPGVQVGVGVCGWLLFCLGWSVNKFSRIKQAFEQSSEEREEVGSMET